MVEVTPIVRWVHVLSAAAWLGEVAAVNFVLLPALSRFGSDTRARFRSVVFPRVFRMASVLSGAAVVSGAALLYLNTGGRWSVLVETRWGRFVLLGGVLGLALTLFHFLVEHRLTDAIRGGGVGADGSLDGADGSFEGVDRPLRIIPRVGLGILVVIFLCMMYAARGL